MAAEEKKFQEMIDDIAENNEWEVEWNEGMASIDFEAESGNVITLYITFNEGVVEFDMTSEAGFASEEEIPSELSTLLLKRNSLLSVGAWAVEDWDGEWYYSLLYNTTLAELEPMEYETIQEKVDAMVEEVDEFNGIWAEEE